MRSGPDRGGIVFNFPQNLYNSAGSLQHITGSLYNIAALFYNITGSLYNIAELFYNCSTPQKLDR